MAKSQAMQKIRITKPCMVGGKPAKVGAEPTVPQEEANQLIGTLCAKPVTGNTAIATQAEAGVVSKPAQGAK